jgi:HEPN domain-containing protein
LRQATQLALAKCDIDKAETRLKVLALLLQEQAYSDVVREAQELVELALKGILFQAGIDPPRQHDVGWFFKEKRRQLPEPVTRSVNRLADISARLGQERNDSLYGDQNCIPTEAYTRQDAEQALEDASFIYQLAKEVIPDR